MEKIVFYLLLFFAPTQLAYHFWPDFAYTFGIRVDYLSPTIYITDILIFLLLIFRLSKLRAIKLNKRALYLVVGVLLFSVINVILASKSYPAIYKWTKIGEFAFLTIYVFSKKEFRVRTWLVRPLAASLVIISLIGILHFLVNRTLGGPLYFIGERTFTKDSPGIALVTIFGRDFLRAYSTFPHPNSFAGYLAVALIIVWGYLPRGFLKTASIIFGVSAIVLSFSFGVYLSALIILFFHHLFYSRLKPARSGSLIIFVAVLLGSFTLPFIFKSLISNPYFPATVTERLFLDQKALNVFYTNPFMGAGLNNFLVVSRLLQPPHNIFLLMLSEVGIFGSLAFIYLIYKCLEFSLQRKNWPVLYALLVIIMTGFVDHYWVTLQQNQILLSIILGLSLRPKDL